MFNAEAQVALSKKPSLPALTYSLLSSLLPMTNQFLQSDLWLSMFFVDMATLVFLSCSVWP